MEMAYDEAQIAAAVAETVHANGIGRGLIKVMAYWGEEAIVQMVLDKPLDVAVFAIPNGGELHLHEMLAISACLSKWRKLHPETVAVEARQPVIISAVIWRARKRVTEASTLESC